MDTLPLFTGDTPQQESTTTETGIVPRATVRDMVRRRNEAIDAYRKGFIALHAAEEALREARQRYAAIDPYAHQRESSYTYSTQDEDRRFISKLDVPSREDYEAIARKVIDRRAWATLIEMTDLEKLMDKEAKDQLREQLQETVPEVTEENVWATLDQFRADAGTIFRRGIANCFSKLDRRFRSHDGWKVGSRVILSYMFDGSGYWSYRSNHRDTLHDIDRTFCVLDGRNNPDMIGGIVAAVEQARGRGWGARQTEVESDYFKVRAFKNGNAHIWFKRKDLVEKVNRLLGEYYGAPIPEERAAEEDTGLNTPKTSLAKNYGFYPTPDQLADSVLTDVPLYRADDAPPLRILEPSAGTGQLARRIAAHKGKPQVDCIEVQPELCERLERLGLSVRCADFLTVVPMPVYDLVVMNPPFDRERDIDHVMHALKFLKPDGALVAIMSAGTEFRDTKKSRAFRAHMRGLGARIRDLPPGSFSSVGTNCNTIMVRLYLKDRHQYWGHSFEAEQ